MKKKLLILIMAVSMVCLVGCGKDTKVQEKPIPNNDVSVVESGEKLTDESDISGEQLSSGEIEELESAYEKVRNILPEEIKEYTAAFMGIETYVTQDTDVSIKELGVSTILEHLKNDTDPYSKLSYVLKDVNGDGVNELLIYDNTIEDKNVIISMYTLTGEEKECYHILNSQTNYKFKLCENNVIKTELTDVEDTGKTIVGYHTLDNEYNFVEKEIPSGENVNYSEIELEKKPIK